MGRGLVLVVEDSRLINDLLVETLTGAGFRCLQAFDGQQALSMFGEGPPDALVLDLNLPKIHGLEVLRKVKRESPSTVVVVLTGHGSEQVAVRALKLGADEYLSKPFRREQFLASLEKNLARAEREKSAESPDGCASGLGEEYFARLFFGAPAALAGADRLGTIRAANQALARLVGRKPEDLVGRPLEELVLPEVRSAWVADLVRDADTPRGYEGEVFLDARHGDPVPAAVLAVQTAASGDLILSLRDVRRQKVMEEHFYESKKLASLGRVVEGVAHEVRNPLISIGGFARKLSRELPEGASQRKYVDVILSEVQRLERMVQDIEGYVRFTSHRRPRFAPVELVGLVSEAVETVRSRMRDWEGQVRQEGSADVPAVFGDQSLLRELIEGLVENAIDAMPRGGQLSVRHENAGSWVRVRVEDTGVGISEADLEAVFDPFFTSKTSGAGLGLARAYMIVEEHSGTIEFESQVGKGTVCTVSLPIDRRRVARISS